ncbi:MAG: hypothetical protein LQ344_005995 [Seirophora lacunosa]|nr:MAG: hypothetical protein LQ344_005995 [Seirophora lacunosa]
MCIHHIAHHIPCGHTSQKTNDIVKCHPVISALDWYHDQPNEALRNREARCYYLNPMKMPETCGAALVHPFRAGVFIGHQHPNSIIPAGWTPDMTRYVRRLLDEGEDIRSAVIVLETEFPSMLDRLSEDWIRFLRDCFHAHWQLHWDPDTGSDLENGGFGGDIIVVAAGYGCGRSTTGDPRCLAKWEVGNGTVVRCPYIVACEGGAVGCDERTVLSSSPVVDSDKVPFEERMRLEIERQASLAANTILPAWNRGFPPTPPHQGCQAWDPAQLGVAAADHSCPTGVITHQSEPDGSTSGIPAQDLVTRAVSAGPEDFHEYEDEDEILDANVADLTVSDLLPERCPMEQGKKKAKTVVGVGERGGEAC